MNAYCTRESFLGSAWLSIIDPGYRRLCVMAGARWRVHFCVCADGYERPTTRSCAHTFCVCVGSDVCRFKCTDGCVLYAAAAVLSSLRAGACRFSMHGVCKRCSHLWMSSRVRAVCSRCVSLGCVWCVVPSSCVMRDKTWDASLHCVSHIRVGCACVHRPPSVISD